MIEKRDLCLLTVMVFAIIITVFGLKTLSDTNFVKAYDETVKETENVTETLESSKSHSKYMNLAVVTKSPDKKTFAGPLVGRYVSYEEHTKHEIELVENIKEMVVEYDEKEDALSKKIAIEEEVEEKEPETKKIEVTTAEETVAEFSSEVTYISKDFDGNIIYSVLSFGLYEPKKNDALDEEITIVTDKGPLAGYVLKTEVKGSFKEEVITSFVVKTSDSDEKDLNTKTVVETEIASEASSESVSETFSENASESASETKVETTTKSDKEESSSAAKKDEYYLYSLDVELRKITKSGWYDDGENKYYFYVKSGKLVPATGYKVVDGTRYHFDNTGRLNCMRGVDISQWNGDVDFKKVKADGYSFVILRACGRGYSSGKLFCDTAFEENYKNAKAAGLKVGVYVFSQAINNQEALEEASLLVELCKGKDIDGPLFIDSEQCNDGARQDVISRRKRTDVIKIFRDAVESNGYKSGLYTATSWYEDEMIGEELQGMVLWLAKWASEEPELSYDLWQYSSKGIVDGIKGNVDMNLWVIR